MKNKPNFFFDNRGFPNWGGGGGVFFPHNPVFFSDNDPYRAQVSKIAPEEYSLM